MLGRLRAAPRSGGMRAAQGCTVRDSNCVAAPCATPASVTPAWSHNVLAATHPLLQFDVRANVYTLIAVTGVCVCAWLLRLHTRLQYASKFPCHCLCMPGWQLASCLLVRSRFDSTCQRAAGHPLLAGRVEHLGQLL